MKRQAANEPYEHRARQRLWFLAGFTASVFLVNKASLTFPETRELMKMIPPSGQRTSCQKVTAMHWQKHFKQCADIYGKRLVWFVCFGAWMDSDLCDSQPVSEVSGVGQSSGQADYSDALRRVRGDEVGPGHNDLQHWTSVLTCKHKQNVRIYQLWHALCSLHSALCEALTQQVDFVDDDKGYFLYVAAVLPASAHSIPLLRCGHNEVGLCYSFHVRSHVTCEFHHPTHTLGQ